MTINSSFIKLISTELLATINQITYLNAENIIISQDIHSASIIADLLHLQDITNYSINPNTHNPLNIQPQENHSTGHQNQLRGTHDNNPPLLQQNLTETSPNQSQASPNTSLPGLEIDFAGPLTQYTFYPTFISGTLNRIAPRLTHNSPPPPTEEIIFQSNVQTSTTETLNFNQLTTELNISNISDFFKIFPHTGRPPDLLMNKFIYYLLNTLLIHSIDIYSLLSTIYTIQSDISHPIIIIQFISTLLNNLNYNNTSLITPCIHPSIFIHPTSQSYQFNSIDLSSSISIKSGLPLQCQFRSLPNLYPLLHTYFIQLLHKSINSYISIISSIIPIDSLHINYYLSSLYIDPISYIFIQKQYNPLYYQQYPASHEFTHWSHRSLYQNQSQNTSPHYNQSPIQYQNHRYLNTPLQTPYSSPIATQLPLTNSIKQQHEHKQHNQKVLKFDPLNPNYTPYPASSCPTFHFFNTRHPYHPYYNTYNNNNNQYPPTHSLNHKSHSLSNTTQIPITNSSIPSQPPRYNPILTYNQSTILHIESDSNNINKNQHSSPFTTTELLLSQESDSESSNLSDYDSNIIYDAPLIATISPFTPRSAKSHTKRKRRKPHTSSKHNNPYSYKSHSPLERPSSQIIAKPQTTSVSQSIYPNPSTKHWYIYAHVLLPTGLTRIKLFADTGASVIATNAKYAKQKYGTMIQVRKRPLHAQVADGRYVALRDFMLFSFAHPKTKEIITTEEVYLLENLQFKFLASHSLLRKLGYKFTSTPPAYREHKPQIEDNFHTMNNWDNHNIHSHCKSTPKTNTKPKLKFVTSRHRHKTYNLNNIDLANSIQNHHKYHSSSLNPIYSLNNIDSSYSEYTLQTPYDEYLNQISSPVHPDIPLINTISSVSSNNTIIPNPPRFHPTLDQFNNTPFINHISNFRATPAEIKAAQQSQAKIHKLGKVPLAHIKRLDDTLYKDTKQMIDKEFPNLFAKHQTHRRVIPNYEFRIDLLPEHKDDIIFKSQYPLNEEKRLAFIYHTLEYIKTGMFVSDTKSPHNVPAITIRKSLQDGTYRIRLAFDFTLLNSKTKDVKSHMPTMQHIFDRLRGPGKFSTTDAKNFFECIQLRKSDQPLTHVTTPVGEFNMTAATYGYKNISAIAQNIANAITRVLASAGAFVDDIYIKHAPDATYEEMLNDVRTLFQSCENHKILLHPEKTFLFVDEIEYIGYRFTQHGTEPQKEYIKKILKFQRPLTKKQIKSYLGVIQYIARYLHKLAHWTTELNQLLHADCKKDWGPSHDKAFDKIQELVKNVKLLAHPTDDGIFLLQTDASYFAIGAVLYQRQFDHEQNQYLWKIIEFYSKQIDKNLLQHPINIKECMAMVHGMNHWRHFLLRALFYVDTDHRNLISLFDDDENKATNMRKQQILITLKWAAMPYHFKLAHLKGTDIILADYLSRDGATHNHVDLDITDPSQAHIVAPIITEIDQTAYLRSMDNLKHYKSYSPIDAAVSPIIKLPYSPSPINTSFNYIQSSPSQLNHILNISFPSNKSTLLYNTSNWTNTDWFHEPTHLHTPLEAINLIKSNIEIKSAIPKHKLTKTKLNKIKQISNHVSHSYNNENKNEFDTYLNNNIKIAQINRFRNSSKRTPTAGDLYDVSQFWNISNETYPTLSSSNINQYDIYNTSKNNRQIILNQISTDTPNYHTDQHGNRRSIRTKRKPKSFYDDSDSDENEIKTDNNNNTKSRGSYRSHNSPESKPSNKHVSPPPVDRNLINHSSIIRSPKHSLFYETLTRIQNPENLRKLLSTDSFRTHQNNDIICINIRHYINNPQLAKQNLSKQFKFIISLIKSNAFYINKYKLLCIKPDKHHPTHRLVVPIRLIKHVLHYVHNSVHQNHPGILQTKAAIEQKFWWWHYSADVKSFVQHCYQCQLTKGTKSRKVGKLAPISSTRHGELVHFDFAGPFHGILSVMVIVDNYTGAVVLVPTNGQTADIVIECIIQHWLPIHGMPSQILTDLGKGFAAALNIKIYKLLGIKKLFTSRYHPQTNAKAERMVQELKKQLRVLNITLDDTLVHNHSPAQKQRAVKQIKLLLPSIQFAINQRHRNFCQTSPNEMLFGKNLNDIKDITKAISGLDELSKDKSAKSRLELINNLKSQLRAIHSHYDIKHSKYVLITKNNFDEYKTDPLFLIGDYVAYYVGDRANTSRKLRRRFTGPWKIINKLNHNTYELLNESTNETMACHAQMLKKYHKNEFTPLAEYNQTELNKRNFIINKINNNAVQRNTHKHRPFTKSLENKQSKIIVENNRNIPK